MQLSVQLEARRDRGDRLDAPLALPNMGGRALVVSLNEHEVGRENDRRVPQQRAWVVVQARA